jgi:hypothetical protein
MDGADIMDLVIGNGWIEGGRLDAAERFEGESGWGRLNGLKEREWIEGESMDVRREQGWREREWI